MKIYFSVDPEISNGETPKNLKKLMHFLQAQGHIIYRAPYVFAQDPDLFLRQELSLKTKVTFVEQREAHMRWIDSSDLLLAEISVPSEGRSMIIQRALDKPDLGLSFTPIIFIKGKRFKRKFGKIVKGLIESGKVLYYEYDKIEDVMNNWQGLLKKATNLKS